MSWSEGDTLLQKAIPIIEKHAPERLQLITYLSNFINVLTNEDFDYIQFRESGTNELFDDLDARDKIYGKYYSKAATDLLKNHDDIVVSHLLRTSRRKVELSELKQTSSGSTSSVDLFWDIWNISREYVRDEDSLIYYTESLMVAFFLSAEEIDSLASQDSKLDSIIKFVEKENSVYQKRLDKALEKDKNLSEIDELTKKLERNLKRALSAHYKKQKTSNADKPSEAPESTEESQLTPEPAETRAEYVDPGFVSSLNDINQRHFELVAERTGRKIEEIQEIMAAYESCLIEDIAARNRTQLLTIFRIRVHFKEATPARKGLNPFTNEPMEFGPRPARLKVKGLGTDRLSGILGNIFSDFINPDD
jgi:hypothetical protein